MDRLLYDRIKEGVLKEVLGILVSYRITVKLIIGGSVCFYTILPVVNGLAWSLIHTLH